MRSISAAALWLALGACATAAGTDGDVDAGFGGDGDGDGDIDLEIDASVPDAMVPDAAPMALTLSQTTSETVVAGVGVGCFDDTGTSETSWYRVFDLPALGVTGPFASEKVSMGVDLVDAEVGGQLTITIKLHTLAGSFVTANLTELASANIQLGSQTATSVDIPLVADMPAGSTLVAEVSSPNLDGTGTGFIIGANELGQTDQAFIRAPACNFSEPITMAAAGFPNAAIILTVSGTH